MPCLRVQTNLTLAPAEARALLAQLSAAVAQALNKSERYVMVALEPGAPMLFAGSDAPLAYLELKSIGLPARMDDLSQMLCRAVGERLGIPEDRIYIEFADAPPHMWGWNGGTFA